MCCLFFSIQSLQCQYLIKSESLTPASPTLNGASVQSHVNEVSTTATGAWQVDVLEQNTWHFLIILDNTWGFDAASKSSIKVTLQSDSIATGPVPDAGSFDDLLFGFTTDNTQYISTWIPMDNTGQKNRIYPACDQSAGLGFGVGDIASLPNTDRNCDIAGGSCVNWKTIQPKNAQSPTVYEYNGFPITWTLENDPVANTMSLSFETDLFSVDFVQNCAFDAMPSGEGLKIYIGGNDPTHSFTVNSFDVEALSETPLPTPMTSSPSKSPSLMPSKSPSMMPSNVPSKSPTFVPSQSPSKSPTNLPSQSPLAAPSNAPTTAPSVAPSVAPSLAPTSPTGNPSSAPSVAPSNAPTYSPSVAPSNSPISAPTPSPSKMPSKLPTTSPSTMPSKSPSTMPSQSPSNLPSNSPSNMPSVTPSASPSKSPSVVPSSAPTKGPSLFPTRAPTEPTVAPSQSPTP